MDTTILAVRTVAATYILTLLKPLLLIVGGLYIVILGLSWWLASAVHGLWWLLAIMATPLCAVLLLALGGSFLLARRLRPQITPSQQQLAEKVTRQISALAEQIGTPKIVIFARVVRDIAMRSNIRDSYIGELAQEPGELRQNFIDLRVSFDAANRASRS